MKNENQSTSPHQQQQQPYLSKSPTKLLLNLLVPPLSLLQLVPYIFLFASGVALGFTLSISLRQHFLQLHPSSTNHQSLSPKNLTSPTSHQHLHPPVSISTSFQTGVKQSFNPPEVSHHMDDEELLWRASLTPRIREYPFHRVPKVAFMFLVRGWVPLSPLWDEFFRGHEGKYSVYVHLTPGSKWTAPATSAFNGRNIPSQAVKWGEFNMIEAERRLLGNALLDVSNSRFVLLSESCIPIFNFTMIYDYLTVSKKSFVGSMDEPGATGRGRYNPRMRTTITINQWRKGSQWFEMDRELAIEVVSDKTYAHLFRKFCKGSCYTDEHYLPTLVATKYSWMNSNRSLTWVDWSRGGPHPARFVRTDVSVDFLKRLRSGSKCEYNGKTTGVCFLFARKFTPNSLDRLLRCCFKDYSEPGELLVSAKPSSRYLDQLNLSGLWRCPVRGSITNVLVLRAVSNSDLSATPLILMDSEI